MLTAIIILSAITWVHNLATLIVLSLLLDDQLISKRINLVGRLLAIFPIWFIALQGIYKLQEFTGEVYEAAGGVL